MVGHSHEFLEKPLPFVHPRRSKMLSHPELDLHLEPVGCLQRRVEVDAVVDDGHHSWLLVQRVGDRTSFGHHVGNQIEKNQLREEIQGRFQDVGGQRWDELQSQHFQRMRRGRAFQPLHREELDAETNLTTTFPQSKNE